MLAKALTIAGSDSGGGAGIQADLKTFAALGVYGMSAITAITAQNTCGVSAVQGIDPEVVAAQIRAVVTDIGVGAAKTGMLFSAEIIQAVATTVRALDLRLLVVDPVMVATSGDRLLQREAEESLRQNILPLATVVTPNLAETEVLVGRKVASLEEMRAAAEQIVAGGARAVVVKGGHAITMPRMCFTMAVAWNCCRVRWSPRLTRTAPAAPSRPPSAPISPVALSCLRRCDGPRRISPERSTTL